MRLLIVGTLKGQLTAATKIAMDNGASVTHAEDIEQALLVHTETQNALLRNLSEAQRAQLESLLRGLLLTFPAEEWGETSPSADNTKTA